VPGEVPRSNPAEAAGRLALPPLPAIVDGHVSHTRFHPIRHRFRYAHYQWLVDLDDLPRPHWPARLLARFDARDHLDGGRLGDGIRGDLQRFLGARGIALNPADRVLMLAHARVLGHAFDPLTVFWCLDPAGAVRAVVFEVHNTYGGRHAYLLDVDERGRAEVDKAFYVSPFNDTSGRYEVHVRLSPQRVGASVALDRDGVRVMTASTTGRPVPATPRTVYRTAGRHALMTQRVSLLIRWHGIRLWLRRLPISPRPTNAHEENVR
jgi:uncharacterized protein